MPPLPGSSALVSFRLTQQLRFCNPHMGVVLPGLGGPALPPGGLSCPDALGAGSLAATFKLVGRGRVGG